MGLFTLSSYSLKEKLMICLLCGWFMLPSDGQSVPVVTDLTGLAASSEAHNPRNISIQLDGTVLWSSAAEGRVILHDEGETLLLELSLPCDMPEQGDRLRIEGECAVVKSRDAIVLSSVPVVENNGLHAIDEKSGNVYLEAGRHPIQVAWFNRTEIFGLDVAYEGPGIPRQTIPDGELYLNLDEAAVGATNAIHGLNYQCFEGQWWRLLPNCDHLASVISGTTTNFDIAVRTRNNHVGLQFSGYLNVPRAGDYTFYLQSDDGSRLFVGPSTLKISTQGSGPLPMATHGASTAESEFQWLEIEGRVVAVHQSATAYEVELMTEAGLVRANVADSTEQPELHSQIRVAGVGRRIRNAGGRWVRSEFFIQRLEYPELQNIPADVGTAGDTNNLPVLTTIDQIFELSLEESSRRYPVKVRGVITSPMEDNGAVLQDSSRGIYVALGGPVNLQVGDYCEIEGTTGPYRFSPYIDATRVEVLGAASLPEPVEPSWDQLINGSLHCNYVELEGVVVFEDWDRVTLLTRGGRINVRLNPDGTPMPEKVLGATVRLRGCLRADWDGFLRRVIVGSIFLDQHWITVVQPAPDDPFRVGYKRVDDLLLYDPEASALQRVRVYGLLIQKGNDFCCLMDGNSGLKFIPANGIDAEVGDMVDVAGFLSLGSGTPVLQEAMVRTTEQAELPPPNPLEPPDLLRDEYDATYVKVEGVLLEVSKHDDQLVLEMQNGLRRFVAELEGEQDAEAWVPGSRLELTGVYVGLGGNRIMGQPISSFRILLNSDAGIVVLSRPPWWTLQRMLNVVGLLAAVLLGALVWIKLLRRTVEIRTEQLENEIHERQHAEHERELEQERARLANDLHDDLGARLTEVNMLASLVKSPFNSDEEKKKYAEELSGIALHMVTSLDEIVWAVNPRNDTVSSLAGYFGAYAQRLLELASINCGLDVAEQLPNVTLDPRFRRSIFLAFKEALANVIQHAGADKVWLRIFVQNDELTVIVTDDGSGFGSGKREAGADGLVNMQERLGALNGTCTIDSEAGKGTTVRLQAPIPGAE
ncbi:PA14 domain-containing protein [Pontiellaceae bacterium B12227]|nr:PA14 domain-containing protein [Pontiellaceae bacterium B12227]